MQQRYFTLNEANELVPSLQEALERGASLAAQARQIEDELRELARKSSSNGGGTVQQQIRQKRLESDEFDKRIRAILRDVVERGIMVRSVENGLVDFPSWREGREIYLCWVLGEPEIGYWHDIDTGFAGRQPL